MLQAVCPLILKGVKELVREKEREKEQRKKEEEKGRRKQKEEEKRELDEDNFIYITNIYENKFCYIFNYSIFDSKYIL